MKEFKGTAGPWNTWMGTYIENDVGSGVCEVFGDLTSLSEDEANANLIAAAPELLETLINLLEVHGDMGSACVWSLSDSKEGIAAYAAIAKALGESK